MAMLEEEFDLSVKVIVVGNGQVGKTSMINRFARGEFTNDYKKTIGTDFFQKRVTDPRSGQEVILNLWDTAGQEEFAKLTRNYYSKAGCALVVFSNDDRASFEAVEEWVDKVRQEVPSIGSRIRIVRNKIDIVHSSVSNEEAEALSRKLQLKVFNSSVRNGVNVQEPFEDVVAEYMNGGVGTNEFAADTIQSVQQSGSSPTEKGNGAAQEVVEEKPFRLDSNRANVQRTGGKKRRFNFTSCSIL